MIKFLHLLSVIVFCTINLIECLSSIHDELRNYYDSSVQQQFKQEWKKYRKAFENEIASGLRENFGTTAINIYEPDKHTAHLVARGFHLTDGVVMVYFSEMVLRELPTLLRPNLEMELPSNFIKFESKLGRMFIDTTYYVARNSSSIIYARPEDQKALSPFSLQQVDTLGKVVIIAEDCLLSGNSIATLSGDSVAVGHSPFLLTDCKLTVEISTPNSGAPPVIAPYFPPGPKETLEMIIAKPIREELQTKLQGAMYSYLNTSVLFGNAAVDFRNNQQKLFKSYADFMTDYAAKLNQKTIKANKAHVNLPDFEVTIAIQTDKKRSQCHVALKEIVLYGLDTAYVTRAGGPFNDGSPKTAADAIIFSSMQIRGKITHDDKNGSLTRDFAAELTDVTVIVVIVIDEDKTKLQQIRFTGWRSLEFSIIPREISYEKRHDHQSLVYGHILNELPVRVLNHVTSILGLHYNGGNSGGNGGGDDNHEINDSSEGGNGADENNDGSDKHNDGIDDGNNSEEGANEKTINGNDEKITNNKTDGFFSDDILDDNFFSDDFLDKNFFNDSKEILDKNFFSDSKEMIDNNFFNESTENTLNEVYDYVESTTTGAVTGSDDKDNDMNEGDEGGLSNDMTDKGLESDNGNISGGDDVDNENASGEINGDVDDKEKYTVKAKKTAPSFDNDGDDEEQVNTNMDNNFFSDDFIEKDFFSDDGFGEDFGSKEQIDDSGKVKDNNGNERDQIDNSDDGNDESDVNAGNGGQIGENEGNVEGENEEDVIGNNGKDKDDAIDTAENDSDVPDINADGGDSTDSYLKKSVGDAAKKYFSDDNKPFFSDDFIKKDFFSDDGFGSKEQSNEPGKDNDNNDNGQDQIDNADDVSDVPYVNGGDVDKDDRNIDGKKEEDVIEENGKDEDYSADKDETGNEGANVNAGSGGQMNMHEGNIDSTAEEKSEDGAAKLSLSDDKAFFSDDILDEDFFSDKNIKSGKKLTGTAGGNQQNQGDFSLDSQFFSDENINGKKTKLEAKAGGNKQAEGDRDDAKHNVKPVAKKNMWVFASQEDRNIKDELQDISDLDLDRRDGSRRHVVQHNDPNDAANVSAHSDVDGKPEKIEIPNEKNYTIKSTSKENVAESLEDSREGKKVVLPSNVHNTRRHQNMHTSENEIR